MPVALALRVAYSTSALPAIHGALRADCLNDFQFQLCLQRRGAMFGR
jgi:hypothetical protein